MNQKKMKHYSKVGAVLRNTQKDHAYLHLGEQRYRNLTTGVEGEIPDDIAKKIFLLNVELTEMIAINPEIENLITKLNLKFEPKKQTT